MARLILIGAGSQVAKAIAARFDDMSIVGVARGEAEAVSETAAIVLRYEDVPVELDFRDAVVVNCVGTPHGGEAMLMRINCEVARKWCEAAAAGGGRHFVQISSFSVFGDAARIDQNTPLFPTGAYGRAKLAAELALASLQSEGFKVTWLRAPILVGGRQDKLAKLLRLFVAIRFVPSVRVPVRRSMLSYDGLAAVVRHVVDFGVAGACMAADPQCFSYELLRRIAQDTSRPLGALPVPSVGVAILQRFAPGLGRRLFASSELAADANLASQALPFVRLSEVVSRMLRG